MATADDAWLKDHFVRFQTLGFYLVQIKHGLKSPVEDKWQTHSTNAMATWQTWSGSGVGCHLENSKIVVIDLDNKHGKNGFLSWQDALDELQIDLPHTLEVDTPSGGRHIYFRAKESRKSIIGWRSGIDIKSTGQVVLPPTWTKKIVDENGKIDQHEGYYKIRKGYDLKDFGGVLPVIPDELERFIYGDNKNDQKQPRFEVPNKIVGGIRNKTLYKQACSLVAQSLHPEAIVASINSTNALICEPPLAASEIMKIIDSAEKKRLTSEEKEKRNAENREKKKYADVKVYFENMYAERRFCPIKEDLYVKMPYNEWEKATNQLAILKSRSHENNINNASIADHLAHWASKSQSICHERKMLVDVPEWDGIGRIVKFFGALNIENLPGEVGYQLFRHYLANIWRRIEDPKVRNWALVLVGDQNVGKDWWVRELLSGFDKRYYYVTLKVFSDEIRTFSHIDGRLVLNISEFDNTTKWDPAFLKDLVTMEDVDYIPKYGKTTRLTPTRHSIIATANRMDFLRDYTGSSRFLVFKLANGQSIDFQHYPRDQSLQILAESRQLARDGFVASQEAIKALEGYQAEITPENLTEMVKTDFNAMLAAMDARASLAATPIDHAVSELDSEIETLCKRYGFSRDKIFKILKPDFGSGDSKKKCYKRRLQ